MIGWGVLVMLVVAAANVVYCSIHQIDTRRVMLVEIMAMTFKAGLEIITEQQQSGH
jgi:hypothetical protein